jgi:hypothetical protein
MAGVFQDTLFLVVFCSNKILVFLKRIPCFIVNLKKENMQKEKPHIINSALLWEYDLDTFNYLKSYKIVIERVLERGNLEEWREMVSLYSKEQILDTIEWSAQLEQRDKDFSKFFLTSEFLHAA